MATPYFVADSATVTVSRSLASSAFGSYSLDLPEGISVEDVHEFQAPGNVLGYVSQLVPGRRVGGLARRFVRADVKVTAAKPEEQDWVAATNVDAVLQESRDRVAAEFFLESDISIAGLGPWVPLVDFVVGDMAHVQIWGQVLSLPITRIEPIVTDHSITDWRVHVGGQVISDEDARLAENETIRRALMQDRRELAEINVRAVDAQSRAKKINTSLTGFQDRSIEEAVAQRTGVAGQLAETAGSALDTAQMLDVDIDLAVEQVARGLDIEVPPGKETRVMFSIVQVLALAIQANKQSIEATQKAVAVEAEARQLLEREATRMVWADREQAVENVDIRLSNPRHSRYTIIECYGTWEGVVVLSTVVQVPKGTGIGVIAVNEAWQKYYRVTSTSRRFVHDNGVGPSVMHSTVFYQKWAPGKDFSEVPNNA